ncbi:MAG: 50S ribosomal protein L6 [Deltaproteobacteria bacterium]|nr:50S ribosomal protein L6 [Deltaproteobacteria bacterium]
MAGLGSWPVPIPDKVKVSILNGRVSVQGAKGQLEMSVDPTISVEVANNNIAIGRTEESRRAKSIHGMTRKMIANMVEGVSKGFTRTLEISGVGYRAEAIGKAGIQLSLGYSHPIFYQLPPGIQAKIERQTVITLEGIDKQLLGEVTVGIRRLRPPDPYKAKGVKLAEEKVRRKAGKTAGAR